MYSPFSIAPFIGLFAYLIYGDLFSCRASYTFENSQMYHCDKIIRLQEGVHIVMKGLNIVIQGRYTYSKRVYYLLVIRVY